MNESFEAEPMRPVTDITLIRRAQIDAEKDFSLENQLASRLGGEVPEDALDKPVEAEVFRLPKLPGRNLGLEIHQGDFELQETSSTGRGRPSSVGKFLSRVFGWEMRGQAMAYLEEGPKEKKSKGTLFINMNNVPPDVLEKHYADVEELHRLDEKIAEAEVPSIRNEFLDQSANIYAQVRKRLKEFDI